MDALRIHATEDIAYHAVFARGVNSLNHNQNATLAIREQFVLQFRNRLQIFLKDGRNRFARNSLVIVGLPIFQMQFGFWIDLEFRKFNGHGFPCFERQFCRVLSQG